MYEIGDILSFWGSFTPSAGPPVERVDSLLERPVRSSARCSPLVGLSFGLVGLQKRQSLRTVTVSMSSSQHSKGSEQAIHSISFKWPHFQTYLVSSHMTIGEVVRLKGPVRRESPHRNDDAVENFTKGVSWIGNLCRLGGRSRRGTVDVEEKLKWNDVGFHGHY